MEPLEYPFPPDKIPPQSVEAERAVLGAMLVERAAIEKAAAILAPTDFYWEAHAEIFDAMTAMADRYEPVDLLTLAASLRDRGTLDQVGSNPYLVQLTDVVAHAAYVEHYARIVEEKSVARALIAASLRIQDVAHSEWSSAGAMTDAAQGEVQKACERRGLQSAMKMRQAVSESFDQIEQRSNKDIQFGVLSGFDELDYMTGGFQRGDLIVVGARPSMGKTALLTSILCHAARTSGPVMMFTLEMGCHALATRLIATYSKVDSHFLRTGIVADRDWVSVGEACGVLSELPVWMDDSASLDVMGMRSRLRKVHAETGGLKMVAVDYLQLMNDPRGENRTQEIGNISRGLKQIAREFNIPVIALAQLSRAVEQRAEKRPVMSDLRESGNIEAEADLCLLLFRPDYYEPRQIIESQDAVPCEVIVGKHRSGPTGKVLLSFNKRLASFENYHYTRIDE